MAGALEGIRQEADSLSAGADRGDVYVLPAAAAAAHAHEVHEHAGALQRRTVTDAGNPGVVRRWLEKDHYLNLNLAREQRDKTAAPGGVTSRGAFQEFLENILAPNRRQTNRARL